MSGHIPVTWHLCGDVNSHDLTLAGDGRADLATGTTELSLEAAPSLPNGFDPSLSHLICNFALASYTAVPKVEITDMSGEQIVRLEALTTMTVCNEVISVTNYMTGFSRLPTAVLHAYGEEILVPGAPGTATGVAQYKVELENGEKLEDLTVVPYRFDRKDVRVTPALRIVRDQSRQWTLSDGRDVTGHEPVAGDASRRRQDGNLTPIMADVPVTGLADVDAATYGHEGIRLRRLLSHRQGVRRGGHRGRLPGGAALAEAGAYDVSMRNQFGAGSILGRMETSDHDQAARSALVVCGSDIYSRGSFRPESARGASARAVGPD